MNGRNVNAEATVVTSLICTNVLGVSDEQGPVTATRKIAGLSVPAARPGFPPRARMRVGVLADGQVWEGREKLPDASEAADANT